MRILHIDTELGFRGGQRQVQLLVEGLHRRGVEVLLAGPERSELLAKVESGGIRVARYTKPKLLGMRSPLLHRWLRRVAEEFQPDVVHAHSGNAHTLAVGALLGRRPIVTTRRVDFAIKGNRFSRAKYTAPGQRFIAISNGVRRVLEEGGVPPERIDVVFSGVEVERVRGGNGTALRSAWLGGEAGPLVGFVGALVDHKAPWVLAEALPLVRRELPGARVVFIGEGELRGMLEERAARTPGVVLAGWRADVADCYAALDLFVMPSKLEGLCTALVDALAAGVPAVASNTGGIPDVVVHGETGLLVKPEDAEALARAIVQCWTDQNLRSTFIEQGRARVAQHFTADAMVEGTMEVYRGLGA